ncbi:MAG: anthranilate phosphoribosyltransferase [Chitinivibrionales bacterium]|nr:anthranilate phosphoribosyltransferase [Chitinivibrionales bacterium]MBD3356654.1 anthranilate phosphoribosyltransferase [Chitinivibrionales bacterium]
MGIQQAIQLVINRTDLTLEQCREAFDKIMGGEATDAQIAAFIVALRMKGETFDEIAAAAAVMREKAARIVPARTDYLVDTCGTGGDGSNSFNISTAVAFVAAGAGAQVAKHGNRSVSSRSGSADVLEALGVNIGIGPEAMKECLDEAGICFLFAPAVHKAMKFAIGPRKEIAARTIFNLLGPLTNPAGAKRQLLGVFAPELTQPMAEALRTLKSEKAYVVHGLDRLDEASLSDETQITELSAGEVKTYRIEPEHFGLERAERESIAGGTAQENAGIIRKILSGAKGPARDVVVLNAAFAIAAAGLGESPRQGVDLAIESIDTGAARSKLEKLIGMTQKMD